MAGDEDALQAAADELYSVDPDAFMQRRAELSAEVKKSGDAATAKKIGALRKPTRSAYTVNRLARRIRTRSRSCSTWAVSSATRRSPSMPSRSAS